VAPATQEVNTNLTIAIVDSATNMFPTGHPPHALALLNRCHLHIECVSTYTLVLSSAPSLVNRC